MKRKRIVLSIAALALLVIVAAALYMHFRMPMFSGSRVKNPDAYQLDIARMNGTDSHTLTADAGDRLQVHFEALHGEMNLEIRDPAGNTIYSGDGKACTDFTLDIEQAGGYTVSIAARQGKGNLKIAVLKNGNT